MRRIICFLAFVLTFNMVSFTAHAGTWYRPGRNHTFYTGKPGQRGEQVDAEIVVSSSTDTYRAKVNGQWASNQWICHPDTYNGEEYWSYFDEQGKEVLHWQKIDGNWYNFGGGGSMVTGWYRTEQQYYYFDPVTGIMQTEGTAVRDGVTYAFKQDGLSEKVDGLKDARNGGTEGWIEENGKTYYLRDGQKVTNEWLHDGNQKYYVGEDGARYYGLQKIDGYYYMFLGTGCLYQGSSITYGDGNKYQFDQSGRGVIVEMDAQERMKYSAATCWCNRTYEIYERAEQMMFWERRDEEKILEGLRRQWGITSEAECREMIQKLFSTGQSTEDKAEKAWDFSRAMMLCETGLWAGWWEFPEQIDLQLAMAPTIQQSFSSWDDFNDSYMEGLRRWTGGSGETYENRVQEYEIMKQHGTSYDVDWNTKLEKSW